MKSKDINWKTILALVAAVASGFSAGGYIEPSNIEKRLDSIENRLTAIETKIELVLDEDKKLAKDFRVETTEPTLNERSDKAAEKRLAAVKDSQTGRGK